MPSAAAAGLRCAGHGRRGSPACRSGPAGSPSPGADGARRHRASGRAVRSPPGSVRPLSMASVRSQGGTPRRRRGTARHARYRGWCLAPNVADSVRSTPSSDPTFSPRWATISSTAAPLSRTPTDFASDWTHAVRSRARFGGVVETIVAPAPLSAMSNAFGRRWLPLDHQLGGRERIGEIGDEPAPLVGGESPGHGDDDPALGQKGGGVGGVDDR